MSTVIVRNKAAAEKLTVLEAAGSTVVVDAGGSHGCKVGNGLSIEFSKEGRSIEVEAGGAPLVVKLLAEDGTLASQHDVPAGATVSFTGSHALSINLAPDAQATPDPVPVPAPAAAADPKPAGG